MKVTILQIKVAHTVIFWILSLCTVYALYSGVADRITTWTWVAVVLLLVESVVLVAFGWTCPLTILAERQGSAQRIRERHLPAEVAGRSDLPRLWHDVRHRPRIDPLAHVPLGRAAWVLPPE